MRETAEEPQLNDLRHARIGDGQPREQMVDRDHVIERRRLRWIRVFYAYAMKVTAALPGLSSSRVIDQETPHGDRRDDEKLRFGPGRKRRGSCDMDEKFADKRGCLKRVVATFAAHLRLRDAPKLRIEQRQDPIARLRIRFRLGQQRRELVPGPVSTRRRGHIISHSVM